ncbi:uncharacterized protein N7477_001779 [Penicillium maclennaniae]|uniref:uncharacterized protein n=1 Tax=Penicillium maclennaniae TaxID=1343394 RepID=UPI002540841E|nr:uncharacterized protein N7477_001779 [Penicillium maclennaniae]KAJ5681839.1 hypothetical protein N7477_001779 [Penicillium maclennaniae]
MSTVQFKGTQSRPRRLQGRASSTSFCIVRNELVDEVTLGSGNHSEAYELIAQFKQCKEDCKALTEERSLTNRPGYNFYTASSSPNR